MAFMESLRYKLAAALSPKQMTQQISRPRPLGKDNWLSYKTDGLTYTDYDKMLKDPQIKSGYELIRMFLLSRKLIVEPFDGSDEAEKLAEDFEDMLKQMDYPLRKVRNDMYSALVYGYSVSEIVWGADEKSNRIDIKRIRPIPIDTLEDCFSYDDQGDLEMILQSDPEGGSDIEIDPTKCLIYTYDESFGDRSGCSLLDAVYDNWYMKQNLLKWWNVYLQKHEGPTTAVFLENPAMKTEAQDMMDDVREGRANITLGEKDRIDIIESSHRGEGFKEAINYHDVMIFRKMGIGTMILGQEEGKGAYAQSKTQMDAFSVFLDGIHKDIAAELKVKCHEWVDMHSNNELYPHIKFESFEEKDLLELARVMDLFIKDMAVDPSDEWFKHLLKRIVHEYVDVDMTAFLEEAEQPQVPKGVVQPTAEEKAASLAPEQTNLAENINKVFTLPGQSEPGAKKEKSLPESTPVPKQ